MSPSPDLFCFFPTFNDNGITGGPNSEPFQTIHLPVPDVFWTFCQEQGISSFQLLAASWAVTLKTYTGDNQVLFGIEDGAINEQIIRCCVDVESNHPPLMVVGEMLQKSHRLMPGDTRFGTFNSAIVTNCKPSGLLPPQSNIIIGLDSTDPSASIRFTHPLSILPEGQAIRVCRAFGQAILEIIKHPKLAINEINLSTADDLALLMEWNHQPLVAKEYTVPQLIHQQAVARPNAVGVHAWDGSITYRDLDLLSNRLALYLRTQGLKHKEFVPLLFEKSKWTTLAMLGVMKAGAAFLLFDPAFPVQRLRDMAGQAGARVVLCSESLVSKAHELGQGAIPVTDRPSIWSLSQFYADIDNDHWQQDAKPDDAAYAAFTSGSTGKPKCSVISHRSYTSAALAQIEPLGLTSSSRVLQFCSYSFDVSILETLTPLIAGACVCVPSTEESRSNLASAICQFDVNLSISTPSVYRTIDPVQVPCLQTIIMGGEPVTETDILQWTGSHIKMMIAYGPCECTPMTALHYNVQGSRDRHVIGSGLGAALWITNPEDPTILQPIGAPGELLIEGPLVGRGYLNDPDKTQAAFIEPPPWLAAIRGKIMIKKLYRTGDLVHYTADGRIKYVGRKDSQVKLNGQRLELEEVQRKLKDILGDTASDVFADVITPSDPGSRPTLVGFIRFHDAKESSPSDPNSLFISPSEEGLQLSKAITTKAYRFLPRYMVPSVILPLSSVPFTATDKVNRKEIRIQASALSRQQLASYVSNRVDMLAPRTVQEKLIYQLTKDVLRLETFGIDDNFFHLGGDSLAAMRLVTLARKADLQLKTTDVFNQPRLADLASYVSVRSKQPVRANVVAPFSLLSGPVQQQDIVYQAWRQCGIPSEDIEDIYPCTPLQKAMMALTTANPGTYISHSIFDLPADLDLARFKKSWEEVVKHNPILRTRIIQVDSEQFQFVVREDIAWGKPGSIQVDGMQGPFGLGEPMIRLTMDEKKRIFYMSLHHSIYDGWSLPLILKQVSNAYFGQTLNHRPFAPFVHYLLQTKSPAVEDFWRQQLKGYTGTSFPSASANYQGKDAQATSIRSIPLNKTTALQGTTLATAIRLAWALTLAHYTGSTDVVMGLVGSGRNVPLDGVDQITGPTITTMPCRVVMDLSQTVQQHLVQIQTQAAAAIPFEHIGLQWLARMGGECTSAAMVRNLLVVQPEHDAIPQIFGELAPGGFDVRINSFGLVLECDLGSEVLNVRAHYNTSVLHQNEIDNILNHFAGLLTEIRSKPQVKISELSTISAQDLARVKSWNASVAEPVNRSIQDLTRQHAHSQPKAPTVEAWDGNLSYKELDYASSVIASQLSALVAPETFVPLYFQKSKWAIVATLGVLQSGAAFVLLDSSYPPNRIDTICRQAQTSVILTAEKHGKRLHDWAGLTVVIANEPDASIAEILFTLTNGGCVCVPREEDRVINIVEYINQFAVTNVFQTPSRARTLSPSQIPSVATMILCGESMKQTDISIWADRVHLMNAYGPPESSVQNMKQSHVKRDTNASNIGTGSSAACWIVNPEGIEKLPPIGAAGELLIEGPIVSRNYLNEPEKTAAVLIDSPQWLRSIRGDQYHSRLYRTGDLGQYDLSMDGSLLFVDRKDNQIKLCGQRIELGEIEVHILHAVPGLRDVVVELVTAEKKPPTLFAFLWSGQDDGNDDTDSSNDALFLQPSHHFQSLVKNTQASLAAQLPASMIPSVYFPLRYIPRSNTGQVDRKRLRETAATISLKETMSLCQETHVGRRGAQNGRGKKSCSTL